jgi:hypothetical protein
VAIARVVDRGWGWIAGIGSRAGAFIRRVAGRVGAVATAAGRAASSFIRACSAPLGAAIAWAAAALARVAAAAIERVQAIGASFGAHLAAFGSHLLVIGSKIVRLVIRRPLDALARTSVAAWGHAAHAASRIAVQARRLAGEVRGVVNAAAESARLAVRQALMRRRA